MERDMEKGEKMRVKEKREHKGEIEPY